MGENRDKIFRGIYMRGWDAKLMGQRLRDNPYRRRDYASWWDQGWTHCDKGRALPSWEQEIPFND